mmetsp:Transcript_11940/g.32149  ORF Transcript_11940/g.32149 Transcript_11940/m.32149 type:complete len:212 (+) Transcript_11940:77-712(+)
MRPARCTSPERLTDACPSQGRNMPPNVGERPCTRAAHVKLPCLHSLTELLTRPAHSVSAQWATHGHAARRAHWRWCGWAESWGTMAIAGDFVATMPTMTTMTTTTPSATIGYQVSVAVLPSELAAPACWRLLVTSVAVHPSWRLSVTSRSELVLSRQPAELPKTSQESLPQPALPPCFDPLPHSADSLRHVCVPVQLRARSGSEHPSWASL